MMNTRHTLLVVSLALAGAGSPSSPAHAQDDDEGGPHDEAIEARQAMFRLYGYHFGMLSDMAKEKRDYDAELAVEAANNLAAVVNLGQSTLWPQGSDKASEGAPTRAMSEIWSTYPEIEDKARALREGVDELVPVAGDGLGALKGAVGDVGGSCKSCHDDFRAEDRG